MNEIYYSNNGRGPGVARIISINNGVVFLERKAKIDSHRKWQRFTLSERFFKSPSCGWKRRTK